MSTIPTSDLASELSELLGQVGGNWSCDEAESAPTDYSDIDRVGIDLAEDHYEAWILSSDRRERVVLRCSDDLQPLIDGLPLIRKIVAVFNYDLTVVGDTLEAREIWTALSHTRFLRAAARLSSISTDHLVKRIRTFEAAARQTYEGSPFVGSVVMPHNIETFRDHAGERFRPFSESIGFDQALLREKWLKPFLEGGDFALVTVSRKGTARGFTDASRLWPSPVEAAPIVELEGLYGHLRPGTSILSASPSGDIFFALPSGVTFVNSKGQWRYQNWSPLETVLARHCQADAVKHVIRLVRSSSYQHRGALFVILRDGVNISDVIPDHRSDRRASGTLRSTVKGVGLADSISVRLLSVASRIDGAIVLDRNGNVLDVASMVAEPSAEALRQAGQNGRQRFSGARTTAAWNASMHGVAIKISDDGPVDVYEGGRLIFHTD